MPHEVFSAAGLRRALVIKLRHHGDVLLAAPVISTLKRIAPQCEVDALVYADTAPMLEGHPALAQLHRIDRNWKRQGLRRQGGAEWRLIRDLRARHYDLVVHLSVHTRGAWLVRLLRPRRSVAPKFRGGFWARSFTHFYPAQSDPQRHTVDTNLDSLRALGVTPTEADQRVVLVPGAEAEARVGELLARHGVGAGGFIHVHPASRWAFKCWPAERVAALCDALAAKGWPLVLTSAPDAAEKALIGDVCAVRNSNAVSSAPTFDLSGQLSLKELAALTARARLFVGVDSAPMHIAAAMGTPVVAIFGPSGDREWGPWGAGHRVVASPDHPCRPCGMAGCNDSKVSDCLTTLPVAQVLAACEELL
ncbi:putative lipopolysaccharide heptosyltransferase III [Sulfuritalea sp.]|uniref:putative lipopolysaccharide heptosyltransferase III n=1 Tax=Sulfuritalea sp. TaxID=2480090 RepID=UPI001AC43441|nr:putative lipopolysaccharide heptosyltransferase III [Sulfuritalea sp.]MBN8475314.1 putative lipopolysaccharide heptosyltransferase III [Sulfuritalea sp.]